MNISEVKAISATYDDIMDYLKKNLLKMEGPRIFQIFNLWIYWIIGFNTKIISGIKKTLELKSREFLLKFYSFHYFIKKMEELFKDCRDFSGFFNYVNKNWKQTCKVNDIANIYDDMTSQPDTLTRCICSQSLENLELLCNYDQQLYKKSNNIYDHTILKTALHWAFYCDNLALFFKLAKYLCRISYKNDIFFDFQVKKNFKFAMFFNLIKANHDSKLKRILLNKRVDTMDEDTMISKLKLYEMLDENDMIDEFESMLKYGFDLAQTSRIFGLVNLDDPKQLATFKSNMQRQLNDINDYKYSQLVVFICQHGIKPSIIKFLLDKFKSMPCIDDDRFQAELVKILIHSIKVYHRGVIRKKGKNFDSMIGANEMINILSTILPILKLNSMLEFKLQFDDLKNEVVEFYTLIFHNKSNIKLIENEENFPSYLYDRKSFKVMDIFISFNLLNKNDLFALLKSIYLDGIEFYDSVPVKIKNFSLFLYYLIDNKLIDFEKFSNWYKVDETLKNIDWLNDIHVSPFYKREHKIYVKNINDIAELTAKKCKENVKMDSLLNICLQKVKKKFVAITDDCLEKSKLPKSIINLLKEIRTKKNKLKFEINLDSFMNEEINIEVSN